MTTYKILQNQLAGTDTLFHFLTTFSYMVLFPMMPRFIISMRELYDHDLWDRWQGIDAGFGVWSHPAVSENAVVSAIAFADANLWQGHGQVVVDGAEDPEAIRLDVLGDGTRQV